MCPFSRANSYNAFFVGLGAVVLIVALVTGLEYGISWYRTKRKERNSKDN